MEIRYALTLKKPMVLLHGKDCVERPVSLVLCCIDIVLCLSLSLGKEGVLI